MSDMEPITLKFKMADAKEVTALMERALAEFSWLDFEGHCPTCVPPLEEKL